MKKISLHALFVLLTSFSLMSQDFYYENYEWESTPSKVELTAEELAMDEVFLKRKDCIELVVQKTGAVEYRLSHKIIQLNTDAGIEKFNKWYLKSGELETKIQKARVIKPNGTIVIQNKSDIKQSFNKDNEVEYRYFAFEGIEKGSIIEIVELSVFPARLSGTAQNLQGTIFYKHVDFELIAPSFLIYAHHSVNGAPQLTRDTTCKEGHNRWFVELHNVKELKEEDWASTDANLQKIFYKLDKNLDSRKSNFYSYDEVTHNIHDIIYAPLSKKETSALTKFIKELKLDNYKTEEGKIRAIENELKHNYAILEEYIEGGESIDFILSKHIMTERGFIRFFAVLMNTIGIEHELVLTCSRYNERFPLKYEAFNFLEEYLIYFPNLKKSLSTDLASRLGFPPFGYIAQNGLFIKNFTLHGNSTAISEVKFIPSVPGNQSEDHLKVDVQFLDDLTTNEIQLTRTSTGYKAGDYQSVLDYVMDEDKKEILDSYLNYIDHTATVENQSFENASSLKFGAEPFIGSGTIQSKVFIERGGDKLLFKAGLLIGPQSELYNREERVQPITGPYERTYKRQIKVQLPTGYTIRNLDDLAINAIPFGEKGTIGFTTNYQVDGDVLTINVVEWYHQVHFEAEHFPAYQQVINAAADFNKVTLILSK